MSNVRTATRQYLRATLTVAVKLIEDGQFGRVGTENAVPLRYRPEPTELHDRFYGAPERTSSRKTPGMLLGALEAIPPRTHHIAPPHSRVHRPVRPQ